MKSDFAIVYAVQRQDGAIKIGVTKAFGDRLAVLASANPGLRVIDAVAVSFAHGRPAEAFAHAEIWRHRLEGEWFAVRLVQARQAISRAIDKARKGDPLPAVIVRHRRAVALKAVQSRKTRAAA